MTTTLVANRGRPGGNVTGFTNVVLGLTPPIRDILELAARYRLPTRMEDRERVEGGARLSYHQDPRGAYRRAAYDVDRVLKGATPGDLPWNSPRTSSS